MKIVVNTKKGGKFDLSKLAFREYQLRKYNQILKGYYVSDIDREDPVLVQVVEKLGEVANTEKSTLTIVDVPYEDFCIEEDDGIESVEEYTPYEPLFVYE